MGMVGSLQGWLAENPRRWLGGDIQVRLKQPPARQQLDAVDRILPRGSVRTIVVETVVMAAPPGIERSGTAILKSVDFARYPLYGGFGLSPPRLLRSGDVAVSKESLARLGVKLGDRLLVANQDYQVVATIEAESDRLAMIPFTPLRIVMSSDGFERLAWEASGGRAVYRLLLKLPDGADLDHCEQGLKGVFEEAEIADRRTGDPGTVMAMRDALQFLNLTATAALGAFLLAGSLLVGGYLEHRLDAIMAMKCCGARPRTVVFLYAVDLGAIITVAAIGGLLIAAGLEWVAIQFLTELFGTPIRTDVASVTLAAMSAWAGFAIVALLHLLPNSRRRPATLQRRNVDPGSGLQGASIGVAPVMAAAAALWGVPWRLAYALPVAVGMVLLGLQAAAKGALRLLGTVLVKGAGLPSFCRYAASNLRWPGSLSVSVFAVTSVSATLLFGLWSISLSLRSTMMENLPGNVLVLNVRPEDEQTLRQVLCTAAESCTLVPYASVDPEGATNSEAIRQETWIATPGQVLPAGFAMRAGTWPPRPGECVVPEKLARLLKVQVGTTLAYVTSTGPFSVRISGIYRSPPLHPASNAIFVDAGEFGRVSAHWLGVATLSAALVSGREAELQNRLPAALVLNLYDLAADLGRRMRAIAAAAVLLAALLSAGTFLVLAATLVNAWKERGSQVAVLKVLGARSNWLASTLLVEFGLLGLAAGTAGVGLGWMFAAVTVQELFLMPLPAFSPGLAAGCISLCWALTTGCGWLSFRSALKIRPASTLRRL